MLEQSFLTERLFIRDYRRSDLEEFLRVVRQEEIYATTYGIPRNYTRRRGKWWLKIIRQNKLFGTSLEYAVFLRDSGVYIGNVGLINIAREHLRGDISYYIDRDCMNRGYATEAAQAMLQYGFEELGFHKISGVCMSRNPASRRVMEKLGMRYEGTLRDDLLKDGVYCDIDRLSILREEYFTNSKADQQSFQHRNVE